MNLTIKDYWFEYKLWLICFIIVNDSDITAGNRVSLGGTFIIFNSKTTKRKKMRSEISNSWEKKNSIISLHLPGFRYQYPSQKPTKTTTLKPGRKKNPNNKQKETPTSNFSLPLP